MRAFHSGDPRWMTYQQAQEKNWHVRKGEKSTTIFFAKPYEVDDDEAEDGKKTVRVLARKSRLSFFLISKYPHGKLQLSRLTFKPG